MDLSHTIVPKSDQLNADDLIAGNITIKVTDIKASDSPDQPVIIHYENDNGRPYKPCKSMRRVLIQAWGANGKQWIGKDRKSTRLNSSHVAISYAVFCLKKKNCDAII